MAGERVAFILGAGAHRPFNMPLGETLKGEVAARLEQQAQSEPDPVKAQLIEWAYSLRACGVSIDRFLTNRKAADRDVRPLIANVLLQYEQNIRHEPLKDWLLYIWPNIIRDKDTISQQFSFITFNYDRTIQYRIARAMHANWGISDLDAFEMVEDHLSIYHVYNSLGSLDPRNGDRATRFGDAVDFVNAGRRLKIIGEHDNATTAEIHRRLEDVTWIFILGCHFHKENMSLLALDQLRRPIYCSNFGFSGIEMQTLARLYPYLQLSDSGWDCLSIIRNRPEFQERLA
jgi:hypothetical protein